MKTVVFDFEIEQEDGRWIANVPSLPGCVVEGDTRIEAFEALKDATQAYLETLIEDGESLSSGVDRDVSSVDIPDVVAVTV